MVTCINYSVHRNPNGQVEADAEAWQRYDKMTHPYFEINKIDKTRWNARNSWINASVELFPESTNEGTESPVTSPTTVDIGGSTPVPVDPTTDMDSTANPTTVTVDPTTGNTVTDTPTESSTAGAANLIPGAFASFVMITLAKLFQF